MGCDWIISDKTWFGFALSFDEVFKETKFDNLDNVGEHGYPALLDENADDDDTDEDGKKINPNPHKAVASAWDLFLEKKHPDVKPLGIKPYIGCTTMMGAYATTRETEHCDVVFGYSLETANLVESSDNKAKKLVEYEFSKKNIFPENMPHLVTNFIYDFRKNCGIAAKAKPASKIAMMLPNVMKFVRI